jgi:hypothetical protein
MTLEFSYAVTLDEYRSAVRLRLRRMRAVAYSLSALCLLATLALLWLDPFVAICAATAGASLALTTGFLVPLLVPWEYRRSGLSGKTFSARVDPDWITLWGADGESKTRWKALRELRENKDVFLLFWQPGIGYVIPKRYLSDQQQSEFRATAHARSEANQAASA